MRLAIALLSISTAAYAGNEALTYAIVWPGGATLGEGRLTASTNAEGLTTYELTLDASIPAITVRDKYTSVVRDVFCTIEFNKEAEHGTRKTREKITIDNQGVATRKTQDGGGSSEIQLAPCARDGLAFLAHARRELSQGRVPKPESVVFGGTYAVMLTYKGARDFRGRTADVVSGAVKGKSSSHTFEILFDRDAARTPLVFSVPFALGTFGMEIVR